MTLSPERHKIMLPFYGGMLFVVKFELIFSSLVFIAPVGAFYWYQKYKKFYCLSVGRLVLKFLLCVM